MYIDIPFKLDNNSQMTTSVLIKMKTICESYKYRITIN